jgi:hypothetical protein
MNRIRPQFAFIVAIGSLMLVISGCVSKSDYDTKVREMKTQAEKAQQEAEAKIKSLEEELAISKKAADLAKESEARAIDALAKAQAQKEAAERQRALADAAKAEAMAQKSGAEPQRVVAKTSTEARQWTPENIKKDQVGYLTWALAEVGKTEDKLRASELSLTTKHNTTRRALERHKADLADYETLLAEFKEAYITASEQKKWPARVRSREYDEMTLKRRIVACDAQVKNAGLQVEAYAKTDKLIRDKQIEVEGKLAEVAKLKDKLSSTLEIARVNGSVDGIESIGDQLKASAGADTAVPMSAEEGMSVPDMIKPSGDAHDDDEFSKIIGKGK